MMPQHIGFTGTQQGMTEKQKAKVRLILSNNFWPEQEFHHGDCLGADAEAVNIASEIGYMIACHPPLFEGKRAFTRFDTIYDAKSYLERNHDIVDAVGLMIATPKETTEVLRSGTWATIRYAQKIGRNIGIIFPDGESYWRNE